MADVDHTEPRAYEKLRALVKKFGGSMDYHPTGRGGEWVVGLHGEKKVIPCPDDRVNELDGFYVPENPTPRTWDDYAADAPLIEENAAFWRLVDLVKQPARR